MLCFYCNFSVYMCVQTHKQFVWVLLTFSAHLLRETNLCIITVLPLNIPTHSNTHTLSSSAYIYTRSHIFCANTYTHSHLCWNSMNNLHLNGMYLSQHFSYFRQHIMFHVIQHLLLKLTSGHTVKCDTVFFCSEQNPQGVAMLCYTNHPKCDNKTLTSVHFVRCVGV